MDIDYLTEEEKTQVVFQQAQNAEVGLYTSRLGDAMGTAPAGQTDSLQKRRDALVKWAGEQGIEGPFLTEAQYESIFDGNVKDVERNYLQVVADRLGGNDNADPEVWATRKDGLIAFKEEYGVRGPEAKKAAAKK